MVNLTIDNIKCEAPEGSTVLTVSKMLGLHVPSLCFKEGLPHYSSCMVCIVKNKKTKKYIPSCCALAEEGMDIDASGDEVITLRKKALELLFSEHRAECEAPCKVVCPAGYNIPLMNRLISAKKFDAALKLSISEHGTSEIMCLKCPGYCENACRRKKVDLPVSIRNMKLFISENINKGDLIIEVAEKNTTDAVIESVQKKEKIPKRFTSHIGKLEETELQEWLKECNDKVIRSREITDYNSAEGEAESCMHCDCRAISDCRLRDLAEELKIKDPRGKLVNAPIIKKINRKTGLIFESAKCIKCGLCVRICTDTVDDPALCFLGRGFTSIISEPLTEEFSNILKTKSKECIAVCPTGALGDINKI